MRNSPPKIILDAYDIFEDDVQLLGELIKVTKLFYDNILFHITTNMDMRKVPHNQ